MASNPRTIERRIDVILAFVDRPTRHRIQGLLTAAFVLTWGAFALAGPVDDDKPSAKSKKVYFPTEESMRSHAKAVYDRVNEYVGGDVDGDGEVSKEECWAFIAAAVLQQPEEILSKYPTADANGDGTIELVEAYEFVRGDHELAKVEKKAQVAYEKAKEAGNDEFADQIKKSAFAKEMETYHFVLDRREALLDLMSTQPDVQMVAAVAKKMAKREAKVEKDKLETACADIAKMREEAATLRAKAAELTGEQAKECKLKAKELEHKAQELTVKVTQFLKEQIAKLEESGDDAQAGELRKQLAKLNG